MWSPRLFISVLLLMVVSFVHAQDSGSTEDPLSSTAAQLTDAQPTDDPSSTDPTSTDTPSSTAAPAVSARKGDDFKIDDKQLNKAEGNNPSMHFGVHELQGKSFRLRLGTPDECSRVVVCVGKVSQENDTIPKFNKTKHCKKEIIFNLKERSVQVNGIDYPFASSVADFLSRGNKVTLKAVTLLKGSNTADLTPNEIDTTWNSQEDSHMTVMGSSIDCPGIVNTFSRHEHTRYHLSNKDTPKYVAEPLAGQAETVKTYAAPLHGGTPGTTENKNSPLTKQCQDSILGETGVAGSGEWIKVEKGAPKAFKYTVGVANGRAHRTTGPIKLHLEIRKPMECEWIRLCFDSSGNACTDPSRVLDLIMRHRFFIQTNYPRGRIFDMPIKEMDLFTLKFDNNAGTVSLETRPSEHGQPLAVEMSLANWDMQTADKDLFLLASRCEFRLAKAKSAVDREQSWQDTSAFKRNNGFIKKCVEMTK